MVSFKVYCEEYNRDFVMAPSKVLGLLNDINLLDNITTVPYGFWVNKWGHWVKTNHHSATADSILNNYQSYSNTVLDNITKADRNYMYLFENGYIRIVNGYDHDGGGSIWWWENRTNDFTPSQSQVKFLNAIKERWNFTITRDTGKDSY
jgi:hypothetical protein